MSADDITDGDEEPSEGTDVPDDGRDHAPDGDDDGLAGTEGSRSRREELTDRLSEETDRAVEEFDQRLVDLLSWMLDTETRARIYVNLRQSPHSTSDEIADGTGLYPSTVREALAELHDEDVVERRKRESEGAGNNPYEYAAIAPSELVGNVAERVQSELNTVFNLDRHIRSGETEFDLDDEPVTITVEDESAPDADEDGETEAKDSDDTDAEPSGVDGPEDGDD